MPRTQETLPTDILPIRDDRILAEPTGDHSEEEVVGDLDVALDLLPLPENAEVIVYMPTLWACDLPLGVHQAPSTSCHPVATQVGTFACLPGRLADPSPPHHPPPPHPPKSELQPSQTFDFIGMQFDTHTLWRPYPRCVSKSSTPWTTGGLSLGSRPETTTGSWESSTSWPR